MKRIIAMDMDGTLLQSDHTINELTTKYIQMLLKKYPDIYPVVCTGRPKSGIQPFLKELGMDEHPCYVISQNGANIFESSTGKRVYDAFLEPEQYTQWTDFATEHHVGLMGVGVKEYFTIDKHPNEYVLQDVKLINASLLYRSPENLQYESLYKILLLDSPENLDALEAKIPSEWREKFYVVRSQPYLIEVLPHSVNKASGLRALCKILEVDLEQTMAIGDAMNDYEMIQEAGFGVAMDNASDTIKDIADMTTFSNDNDGVVYAISHWLHDVLML